MAKSKGLSYTDKNIYLIPGEKIIKSSLLNNYSMSLTNYRLCFICKNNVDKVCHIGIPLNLILKMEQVDFKHMTLWTKVGSVYKLSFDSSDNCHDWLLNITENLNIKNSGKMFAFNFFEGLEKLKSEKWLLNGNTQKSKSTDSKIIKKEFKRMKFSNKIWKITDVNITFQVCNSYPPYHIVPCSISDEDIKAMAEFRGNKRFPSVVWRSQKNGAVIIRCAQPQVGLMFWRNSFDETFFKEVLKCLKYNGNKKRLLIIDARHYSTAQLNRIRGGGVEYSEYYGEAEIVFMQLENIHSVRSSFDCISMFSMNGENWFTSIENSYWLKYLSKLLKSACDITRALNEDGRSVIIHCSDGWDRTPQLTSLSQILLDDFYRTIKGFKVLIEREWIHFGHKFSDRCGFNKSVDNKEWSPIFVQWLDCIHQLIRQYPCYFEFNETFLMIEEDLSLVFNFVKVIVALGNVIMYGVFENAVQFTANRTIKLALHVYSGLFGNFMFNSEEERQKNDIYSSTVCIWNFLSESNEDIINPLFYKFSVTESNYDVYKKVIYPKYTTKFLFPWNRLFFEALNPADIYQIFSLDHSSKSLNNFLNCESEEFVEHDIINNSLSNQTLFLRKSKSDPDVFLKCKEFQESSDLSKPDISIFSYCAMEFEIPKYNGKFINQSSSTSTLNDINFNGFLNENNSQNSEDDQKFMKRNKFQPTELMACCNGNNSELPLNIFLKCDTENTYEKATVLFKLNEQENQYFRLINLDDAKEIGISKENAPCDLDGLYKSVEPINMLANFWKQKLTNQQILIDQLREKLLLKSEKSNKVRNDSASSAEKGRNADSLSSYDSYIMLESPEYNNIFDNSKVEFNCNGSSINNAFVNHTNISLFHDSSNFNKPLCSSSIVRKSTYNQQSYHQYESGNGSKKAQA